MLYHHQQQVLLFKEEVMKQQKLKLCCLRTKQNGRSSCLINLEMRLGLGSFIFQSETTSAIQELVAIFNDYNATWKP